MVSALAAARFEARPVPIDQQPSIGSASEERAVIADLFQRSAPAEAASIFSLCRYAQSKEWVSGSLEMRLAQYACCDVDLRETGDKFVGRKYLTPNEAVGSGLRSLLDDMDRGLIVSVGTERSLFDLALADPERCEGLVVRDINPWVKAYLDFVVCLFRISDSREEFLSLSKPPQEIDREEMGQRLDELRRKIEAARTIPGVVKEYYQKNLDQFARVYYRSLRDSALAHPESPPGFAERYRYLFFAVDYFNRDDIFLKLQKFAREGRIVTTVGTICDLSFLGDKSVSIIDTSNVHNYSMMDIRGYRSDHPPRVIWTVCRGLRIPAIYHSFRYEQLTAEEREELSLFHQRLNPAGPSYLRSLFSSQAGDVDVCSYSKEALEVFRAFWEKLCYEIPEHDFLCFAPNANNEYGIEKLKKLPRATIEFMMKDPAFSRFTEELVKGYDRLGSDLYMKFMDVPGWREAFESAMKEGFVLTRRIFEGLCIDELLKKFCDRFGRERVALWDAKHQAKIRALLGI